MTRNQLNNPQKNTELCRGYVSIFIEKNNYFFIELVWIGSGANECD